MPLSKLQFRPGINREQPDYTNEGGWFDGDKVRFRMGFPEKVGGWQRLFLTSFLGSCRSLHAWRALDDSGFVGVGTHLKFYVEQGGGYNDITPIRETTAAGDVTFAAVDGSAVITVTDTAHGAVQNDFVTFSGAVSLGGDITADILNQEYQIVEVVNSGSYRIQARTVSSIGSITAEGQLTPTLVNATSSDTGDGGASVVATYQINTGLDTSVSGTGWGVGPYSRAAWGEPAGASLVTDKLRLWSQDNFGEDLIINVRNGGVYYWDKSTSTPNVQRAVDISSLPGASDAPVIAKQVLVSDVDRHVIAFGCNPLGSSAQDPLLIRFSDQENAAEWTPRPTNTAGDLVIGSGSEIIQAVETRQQILVFTDTSLHAMQYLGPPFTFGINLISENITIMAPKAAVAVEDSVFWMGKEEFYVYTGSVQKLPCTVKDYIFSRFNLDQREKAFASVNSAFSEIWWFYPSIDSDNIDSYVVYDYEQNIWHYGSLIRTAWIDRGVDDYPIAAGRDGHLYYHEFGLDDGSTNPASPITAYIESSAFDIGDGYQFSFVDKIIPDVTFRTANFAAQQAQAPFVTMTMKARNAPGGSYLQVEDSTVTKVATIGIDQYTEQAFIRLRGRSLAFRIESDTAGVAWRLGSPRINVRPDGRK